MSTMMRAAVIDAPRKAAIRRLPLPEPKAGEIRVRLEGCGVCGSNLAPWEGRPWFNYPFEPGKPGHEGWGEVDLSGPGVEEFQRGDRVALLSYHAFAEFDIARAQEVIRLPRELSGKPFPGEALGCAVNVFRRCEIRRDDTVAIVGIGFLGALLCSLGRRAGARVIAISRREFALEMARTMGAHETILMRDHEAVIERARELTNGSGCDCVIEVVGLQAPLDLASELTRERGRLIIAGYHQDGPRQVNMQLWNWRGLDVINAHERDPNVYVAGMKEAAETIARGEIDPTPLYTHQFSLAEIDGAFDAMMERPHRFLKAIVRV